ncbi:hypothetical protein BT63DRAFT_359529, partial [Microthyrium microscopicum]
KAQDAHSSVPHPPIHPVNLPLVLPHHRYNLAAQGWTTVTLSPQPVVDSQRAADLQSAIAALFAAARVFFDREPEYKARFSTPELSEEGYSAIPGEKEFFTLRSSTHLPDELAEPAARYWALAGELLVDMLDGVSASVDIQPDALRNLAQPCATLSTERTATMLRMFRYEGWEDKIVAEPHCDLGLLSLVVGDAPGLEVWNGLENAFYPVERTYGRLDDKMTVLGGRQLQRLTNGLYAPGGHLVRSYPQGKSEEKKRYRHSIVFVLRAHYPVVIQTKALESEITGSQQLIPDGMTARELFLAIKGAHYNINAGMKDREEQKRRMR